MIRKLTLALMLSGSVLAAQAPAFAQTAAPVSKLVEAVNIPHEKFTLDNGLTVLVHEDRKAPIVAVSIWYGVGSKNEPKGKTGYAHLFEHIMFNGSENAPGDYFEYTKKIGATDLNGTTWLDRTNYYENLPSDHLELAVQLEADRMRNLWLREDDRRPEMTVVRNEMEDGENSPFGILMERVQSTAYLWHNYGKSTIGNRSDIERVPVENLRAFYRRYYQPDNAVLLVAGKFEAASTLALIQQVFGVIPKPNRVIEPTYTQDPSQDGTREVTVRRTGDVQLTAVLYHTAAGSHVDSAAMAALSALISCLWSRLLLEKDTQKGIGWDLSTPFGTTGATLR